MPDKLHNIILAFENLSGTTNQRILLSSSGMYKTAECID